MMPHGQSIYHKVDDWPAQRGEEESGTGEVG